MKMLNEPCPTKECEWCEGKFGEYSWCRSEDRSSDMTMGIWVGDEKS